MTEKLSHAAPCSLPEAVDLAQVIEGDAILGEQAAMHNEDALVQHMRQRQPAEGLSEQVDHIGAVLGLDLQACAHQVRACLQACFPASMHELEVCSHIKALQKKLEAADVQITS